MSRTNYDDGTKSVLRKIGAILLAGVLLLLAVGVLAGLFLSPGCAAGRLEDTGDVVLGVKVGEIPETATQFARKAAGLIPGVGPIAELVIGGLSVAGIGGGGAAVASAAARRAKRREDAAWDEAQKDARLAVNDRDSAFDEGARRAAPVADVSPVAAVPPVPVGSAGGTDPVVASGVATPPAGA